MLYPYHGKLPEEDGFLIKTQNSLYLYTLKTRAPIIDYTLLLTYIFSRDNKIIFDFRIF